MKRLFLYAVTSLIFISLASCKKDSGSTDQPTKTSLEGTCTDLSTEAYPLSSGDVYFNIGGALFIDDSTKERYDLSWQKIIASDANGYGNIVNPDIFTDQTEITKYGTQYITATKVLTPNSMTFQVKSNISADELKNSMLGVKTIKINFKSDITYYIGAFEAWNIDNFYNDKSKVRDFSKKALATINKSELHLDGDQFRLTLTKR